MRVLSLELCQQAAKGDAATIEALASLEGPQVSVALLKLAQLVYDGYRHAAIRWVATDRWSELDDSSAPPTRPAGLQSRPDAGPVPPAAGTKQQALQRLLAKFPERRRDPLGDPLLPPRVSDATVVQAVEALAGRPGTDRWLARAATEAPLEVRVAALVALAGVHGPGDEAVTGAVRLGLKADDATIRAAAMRGCERLGKTGWESALKGLEDPDFDVRAEAARCLGRIGDPQGVSALIKALEQEQSLAALEALAHIGDHAAARPVLQLLQEDHAAAREDERVRLVQALGTLGDRTAVPVLERELSHPQWRVRRAAAGALARVHRPSTAQALALCLHDYYAEVRSACRAAVSALRAAPSKKPPASTRTGSQTR